MPDEFREKSDPEPAETEAIIRVNAPGESQVLRVVEVLDEYLAKLKAGELPDRNQLLSEHPELASQLEACLAGLEFIHSTSDMDHSQRRLGDFQILREVGRGGMGAVYEARQISLGRRVALKILRFGGVSDPDAVQRFQREAQTVASLHHTNIVPIFAVGSEHSVNYFAMQFIEGRGLDQVLREHADRKVPIAPDTVAGWGLQAAEALAHAHARGVIHRDVKPSNLLIDDDEGRVWLTDFGLAKRLDDVTLSMTGALLGTPRYMSPEQAAAAHHKLDHRTDIYSLGATLYELATGQPVFVGNSPHDVISQIIASEPIAPHVHRPSLPRDLDTILVKCLSKDASQRYHSANDLASDLRAFQEGRPISARRVGFTERASRWVKRQRRSVALAGGAVAATLLLTLLVVGISYAYQRSRLASVMLRAKHQPLVAELLDGDTRAVPLIAVPTQQRLEIEAGDYQVRVAGHGRLSQTIGMSLQPGSEIDHELDLDSRLLWKDVELSGGFRLASRMDDNGGTRGVDIIELGEQGIRCIGGLSGYARWDLNLQTPEQDALKAVPQLIWPWNQFHGGSYSRGLGLWDQRPWIIPNEQSDAAETKENTDLNDDGHSDLLLAARHQAWIIAINGRDGKPLWIAARGETTQGEKPKQQYQLTSTTVGPPQLVPDVDDDGVADVVVSFIFAPSKRTETQRWVELLSGRTGESLWKYEIPARYFQLSANEEIPLALQWITGGGGSSGNSGSNRHSYFRTRDAGNHSRSGDHEYAQTPLKLNTDRSAGLTVCGTQLIQLDLRTGQPTTDDSIDLKTRTAVLPKYGDLDGDGEDDLLLVEPITVGGQYNMPQQRLVAMSVKNGTMLWEKVIEAHLPRQAEIDLPVPDWPQVVDSDGDGTCEVIVPSEATAPRAWGRPWGKVQVIDGETGKPRWERQFFSGDQQIDSFIVGPDVDADGVNDLFIASQWGIDLDLFVDCLSGKDGRSLWRLEQPLLMGDHEGGEFRVGRLQWFEATDDGWPQLMIPMQYDETWEVNAGASDRIVFVSAGRGKLTHIALDASHPKIADLDADGTEDLLYGKQANKDDMHASVTLQAIHGVAREAWHRFLPPQRVVGDLDHDGVADSVQDNLVHELVARSGASGKILWQSAVDKASRRYFVHSTAQRDTRHEIGGHHHDLNGDGVPDILLVRDWRLSRGDSRSVLIAVSGIDGQRLWNSQFVVESLEYMSALDCRDLDGDAQAEIIMVVACDFDQPTNVPQHLGSSTHMTGNDRQLWLAVISGNDGSIRWSKPLCGIQVDGNRQFDIKETFIEPCYDDLNQDGVLDLVLPAQSSDGASTLDMLAINGRDGQTFWGVPLPAFDQPEEAFGNAIPAASGDLDGDGTPEVIVMAFGRNRNQHGQPEQLHVSAHGGSDGRRLWQWETIASRDQNQVERRRDRIQDRLRPLLANRTDGTSAVAFLLWNDGRDIHVINHLGEATTQRIVVDSFFDSGERPFVIDADQDGADELLIINRLEISVRPIDHLDQPIWTRQRVMSDMDEIVGILPDENTPGRIVIQGGTLDGSLRGLDPLTGQTDWTCVGPAVDRQIAAEMLSTPSVEVPPFALFQHDGQAMVRRGSSTQTRFADWTGISAEPARTTPQSFDSRLLRPLPWVPQDFEIAEARKAFLWIGLYGLTMGFVPAAFFYWCVSRRRWGLKSMMLLPIVTAIAMIGMLTQPSNFEFAAWDIKLLGAVMALPILFTLVLFTRWWREGKRRRIAISMLVVAFVSISLGMYAVWLDRYRTGLLQPGERYDWSGWYYGLAPVAYWMFLMPCLAVILFLTLRTFWRLFFHGIRSGKSLVRL
ncbi:protein kinase domain-containing protein [Stieleria varia]|uniref:non-specific serine/threonine protein kinase n=1 Tax=Stieleria varia TaxID=2528005 RepID=A0A5C6AR72_9BACT|nr:protein kinase [Stieleria varia]TWU02533.1 Serine/threonine-protein kinase PrkC [Stieleria varia]